jgi:hypothetical protein
MKASGAALASSISYAAMFACTACAYRVASGSSPLAMMWPTRSELADYGALLRHARGVDLLKWRR